MASIQTDAHPGLFPTLMRVVDSAAPFGRPFGSACMMLNKFPLCPVETVLAF
jgi:hypothetical protein